MSTETMYAVEVTSTEAEILSEWLVVGQADDPTMGERFGVLADILERMRPVGSEGRSDD